LAELARKLTPEVMAAAEVQGKAKTLEQAVEAL
jgi:hypothetical protein